MPARTIFPGAIRARAAMSDRVSVAMAALACVYKLRAGTYGPPDQTVLSARAAQLSPDDPLRGLAALIPVAAELREPSRREATADLLEITVERAMRPQPPGMDRADIYG